MSLEQPSPRKRHKHGKKSLRASRNVAYQRQLSERKRVRKERREAIRGPQPTDIIVDDTASDLAFDRARLERETVAVLRKRAKAANVKVPARARKANLIDALLNLNL